MKKIKNLFFTIFILLSLNSFSFADNINKILIKGNKSISEETILALAGINKNIISNNIDFLNQVQKKLFASNFFSNVDIEVNNKTLTIIVIENLLVDYIVLEGIEDRDDIRLKIEKSLLLKSNSFFTESLLNKDLIFIKEYLSSLGYFRNKVTFEVKKVENSRANIFFNINLNNKFLVKNIFFIGDKKFKSSKLASVISTSEDSFLSLFSSSSVPSKDRLSYDISLLKNFYLSEGFYDVQISNASIEEINNNFANITFSISAGEKYIISDYLILDKLSFLQESQILFINNLIKKNISSTYNYLKLIKLRNEINDYLIKINVPSNINYNLTKLSKDKLLVNFSIKEILEKKIINNIVVLGNDITEEKVIRNNLLFSEGDTYNLYNINKSKDKLLSLNLFKNIDIKKLNTSNNEKIDLEIIIVEKPTGEISSGIGIGSEGSTIAFNLKENNFLGKGISADVGLNIGTQKVIGNLSFVNPDFNDSGNSLKNNLFVTKNTYQDAGYENKLFGNNISYKFEIFDDTFFENGLGVSYDNISINDGASDLIASQNGKFLTTKYFYSIISDKRNKKFQPTAGHTIGLGQNFALPPSDIPYISNTFFGSFYKELAEEYIGSIKYKLKSINSIDDSSVLLSDRVFLTSSELRGFAYRGVGPKVNSDFIGGNYSYVTSFSTTIPNGLPDSWNASSSLFLDVGNVWGSDISNIDDASKLRSSVGIGFVWSSPLGPISITYAEAITKSNTDQLESFNFRLGGAF